MSKSESKQVESKQVESKQVVRKLTIKDCMVEIELLTTRVKNLEEKRGPKSQREMTEDDAWSILTGENKTLSHKEAASKLGLSYGQVYSCRGCYTFKKIHDEILEQKKKK